MSTFLWVALAIVCLVGGANAQCDKDHPRVGLTAALSELDKEVSGVVEVLDDCTFQVHNFTYDGSAPDVFWYAAKEGQDIGKGVRLDGIPKSAGSFDGTKEMIVSLGDTTWDDFDVLSVWCRQFAINFGSVTLAAEAPRKKGKGSRKKKTQDTSEVVEESSVQGEKGDGKVVTKGSEEEEEGKDNFAIGSKVPRSLIWALAGFALVGVNFYAYL